MRCADDERDAIHARAGEREHGSAPFDARDGCAEPGDRTIHLARGDADAPCRLEDAERPHGEVPRPHPRLVRWVLCWREDVRGDAVALRSASEWSASGDRRESCSARLRLIVCGEHFFGGSRVARRDDERASVHPCGERVVVHDGHRYVEVICECGLNDMRAETRAAHADDDDAVHGAVRRGHAELHELRARVDELLRERTNGPQEVRSVVPFRKGFEEFAELHTHG